MSVGNKQSIVRNQISPCFFRSSYVFLLYTFPSSSSSSSSNTLPPPLLLLRRQQHPLLRQTKAFMWGVGRALEMGGAMGLEGPQRVRGARRTITPSRRGWRSTVPRSRNHLPPSTKARSLRGPAPKRPSPPRGMRVIAMRVLVWGWQRGGWVWEGRRRERGGRRLGR